ncbi:fimbrial protein [uncultured Porphyromonas sp.]|uniref:fimbrial protein n=1 Tax=uncultured Porphyromonas sp. TaxID=159274 RepID=UPI00261CBCC9|nr:fimbrial protein [uncultured Porphyromonas sp.]
MKRRVYLYYIALPLLLLLAGCVREPMGGLLIPEGKEGDSITLTLGLHADDLSDLALRSEAINDDKVEKITSLRILVFDEHQKFLYSTDAVLGSPASADAFGDDAFLPDGKKGSITKIKSFKATFIQSKEPRYLHFVANYNWTGQTQDYFLVGNSAGAIIPNLTTSIESANGNNDKTKAFDPMWVQVKLNKLDGESLQGKVVKLLRCHAKVTVAVAPELKGFELTGFTACNVHKSGTVAPFVMDNYAFAFPYAPTKATTPSDVKTILNNDPTSIVPANTEFKIFEHQNDGDKKVFLIIRGKKKLMNGTTAERYYKVDFVAKRNKENIVNDRVLPIIRNNHYKVTITAVNSDGYATMAEAIAAPAHNNIFSSIELQEFTQVSGEMFTLKADPVQILIVRPGTYDFNTEFAITDSKYRFKPYGGGTGAGFGAQYIRYYKRWSDNDFYMGALTQTEVSTRSGNEDRFSVEVKNIPSDAVERYSLEVAGLRSYAPDDTPPASSKDLYTYERVDGQPVSGAITPLIRNVEITIRKPLLFKAKLVNDASQTGNKFLEFDLYKNLPNGVFPFEVLIEAPDLSPRNTKGNTENLTIVKRNGKVYYRYIVKKDSYDRHNGRVRIPMLVNNGTNSPKHDIVLTSPYYDTETIYFGSSSYESKLIRLYFKEPGTLRKDGSYNNSRRLMPSTSRFTQLGNAVPQGTYYIQATNTDGQFYLTYDTKKAPANLNQQVTIKSTYQVQSVYGYISFTVSATKTLKEWVESEEHEFTATSVEVKGQLVHYFNGEYYKRPNTQPYWYILDDQEEKYIAIPQCIEVSDTPISQDNLSYEFYLKIPESVFKPYMSLIAVDYKDAGSFSYYYWEDLMNTTRLVWTFPY